MGNDAKRSGAVIRGIGPDAREAVGAFLRERWSSTEMAVHGQVFDLSEADGLYAEEDGEITGLVTYRIEGNEMEILSLDSVNEREGTGTRLLEGAAAKAREAGCALVRLTTTNDNLEALRFYQKRGFDLAALRRNAVDEARKLKPQIPFTGNDGIPIRHEIELERKL